MPKQNDTTAPAADQRRSPRAQPLPETKWDDTDVIPAEQRIDFFPKHPRPRVQLAYSKAKRHFGR